MTAPDSSPDQAKRVFDVAGSAVLLFLLSPILLLVAAVVRSTMGSPIFFRQERPGLHGRPFQLVKFRTMVEDRDRDGRLLPDEERLTRVGRFLRATSMDELPELWNVIKGDMSLVGPRPLLMRYLPLYTPEQARRHEVRPGITGWAQVNGRNQVSWQEQLDMDVWYVDNVSFALDLRILLTTVKRVLAREGVRQEGRSTRDPFTGRDVQESDHARRAE